MQKGSLPERGALLGEKTALSAQPGGRIPDIPQLGLRRFPRRDFRGKAVRREGAQSSWGKITISSILKGAAAATAWGICAGMTMVSPASRG